MHVLDNPAWAALTTCQAQFALGSIARRYLDDLSPIGALGSPDPAAFEELAELTPIGDWISLPATLDGLPLDLESRIAQLLGRPVQVVVLNTAPVSLVHRVLRDGVLVLDSAKSARIRFEVRARNEFFDLQPIVARYRRRPLPAP